jgi:CheY-like chemotaxis protein
VEELPAIERRVVVVEDNRDVRDLLGLMLRRLGHHVATASDGAEGLERIREVRPDAAVVDLGLPGIDGYEVARRTRADFGSDIFLIALSGYGQPEDRKRATDAGFDVHLTKPADIEQLRRALAERRPPREEPQPEVREA